MSGSVAEERIREKVCTALREAYPTARIIHELVLQQGGCRIDVAAITEDRLIVAEVKSERDVLTRLEKQVSEAKRVADGVAVIVAAKHLDAAFNATGIINCWPEDEIRFQCQYSYFQRQVLAATTNAPARLEMLWASELRAVAQSGPKATRRFSIIKASDHLTGSEVRRRVCGALRARHFPRADPPIVSDLYRSLCAGEAA